MTLEQLGYEVEYEDKEIIQYVKYFGLKSLKSNINFNCDDKSIVIYNSISGETIITIFEINHIIAINEKMKELGWEEEYEV